MRGLPHWPGSKLALELTPQCPRQTCRSHCVRKCAITHSGEENRHRADRKRGQWGLSHRAIRDDFLEERTPDLLVVRRCSPTRPRAGGTEVRGKNTAHTVESRGQEKDRALTHRKLRLAGATPLRPQARWSNRTLFSLLSSSKTSQVGFTQGRD